MAKFSTSSMKLTCNRVPASRHVLLYGVIFTSALLFAGCAAEVAVEVENKQAKQEIARLSRPPGSAYTGWRVFQDRCAHCHGLDASGTAIAPDLLPIVREMGSRRFVGLVLQRYDWNLPVGKSGSESATREALIEDIVQRKGPLLTMPAWEGEPRVSAHIVDLFAFLSARANGTQGPGRPIP